MGGVSAGIVNCVSAALVGLLSQSAASTQPTGDNLVRNGDFRGATVDGLPAHWSVRSARPSLSPKIRVVEADGRRNLYMAGAGNPDCVGGVATQVRIAADRTYWFRVRFRKSDDVNPLQHLLFEVATHASSQQIVEFHDLTAGWVEGETRVCFPGAGTVDAEVRATYRLCPAGQVWIERISLIETDPVPPRWARIACTGGPDTLEKYGLPAFAKALDVIGQAGVDLALLPEYFSGEGARETLVGPAATLMSEKAATYGMYVAGTIGLHDQTSDRLFNAALLFDRNGKLIGRYDKIHLYGPELNLGGVTPGDEVPVFRTDFGKVGFMTCYDSWFVDVAELVALRGADILLFPSLNYDRALMHARALDNCINIVASSRAGGCGVWDSGGNELREAPPQQAYTPSCKDIVRTRADGVDILMMTLDLNVPPIGGTRSPAARSKRYLGNQRIGLEDQIRSERNRWWVE